MTSRFSVGHGMRLRRWGPWVRSAPVGLQEALVKFLWESHSRSGLSVPYFAFTCRRRIGLMIPGCLCAQCAHFFLCSFPTPCSSFQHPSVGVPLFSHERQ